MRAGPRVLYLAEAHIMESIISCRYKIEREVLGWTLEEIHSYDNAEKHAVTAFREGSLPQQIVVGFLQMLMSGSSCHQKAGYQPGLPLGKHQLRLICWAWLEWNDVGQLTTTSQKKSQLGWREGEEISDPAEVARPHRSHCTYKEAYSEGMLIKKPKMLICRRRETTWIPAEAL